MHRLGPGTSAEKHPVARAILPYFLVVTRLAAMLEKLTRAPEEAREKNLSAWAATLEGALPIRDARPRQQCRVAGVIQNIRIDPRAGSGSIEATITDGTGDIVARWLGRQSLSGIGLGAGLVLEGIVGIDPAGERTILNPEYRLVQGPEHG